MKHLGRILSAVAMAMLLTGAIVSNVEATGTASIAEIADGVRMVSETVRSTDIMDNVGWIALAFIGLGLLMGHAGSGFLGLFVGLIGLGFWFGSQQIAQTIGWRAVGF